MIYFHEKSKIVMQYMLINPKALNYLDINKNFKIFTKKIIEIVIKQGNKFA